MTSPRELIEVVDAAARRFDRRPMYRASIAVRAEIAACTKESAGSICVLPAGHEGGCID